nr:immunoglobulin heavy chain junction region [Macaca mulatta]
CARGTLAATGIDYW